MHFLCTSCVIILIVINVLYRTLIEHNTFWIGTRDYNIIHVYMVKFPYTSFYYFDPSVIATDLLNLLDFTCMVVWDSNWISLGLWYWLSNFIWITDQHAGLVLGLSLICFYFAYYSILQFLKISLYYYSPQHANYSPIILISSPHLLVHNENSHIHKAVPWLYQDVWYYDIAWSKISWRILTFWTPQCAH